MLEENQSEPEKALEIGDKVTWCHVSGSRNSKSFTTRKGSIVALSGTTTIVRSGNGRRHRLNLSELRREGAKTALTEAFEKLRDRAEG